MAKDEQVLISKIAGRDKINKISDTNPRDEAISEGKGIPLLKGKVGDFLSGPGRVVASLPAMFTNDDFQLALKRKSGDPGVNWAGDIVRDPKTLLNVIATVLGGKTAASVGKTLGLSGKALTSFIGLGGAAGNAPVEVLSADNMEDAAPTVALDVAISTLTPVLGAPIAKKIASTPIGKRITLMLNKNEVSPEDAKKYFPRLVDHFLEGDIDLPNKELDITRNYFNYKASLIKDPIERAKALAKVDIDLSDKIKGSAVRDLDKAYLDYDKVNAAKLSPIPLDNPYKLESYLLTRPGDMAGEDKVINDMIHYRNKLAVSSHSTDDINALDDLFKHKYLREPDSKKIYLNEARNRQKEVRDFFSSTKRGIGKGSVAAQKYISDVAPINRRAYALKKVLSEFDKNAKYDSYLKPEDIIPVSTVTDVLVGANNE